MCDCELSNLLQVAMYQIQFYPIKTFINKTFGTKLAINF